MRSKEEIFAANKLAQNNTWLRSTVDKMEIAMDEYAKEVAISFYDWMENENVDWNKKYTTEDYFNQFLQEIKQDK